MINYKAFFRWLYSAIIHLIDEQVPPEIPKMAQQDVAHITEFLLNFDDISTVDSPDGTKKPKFVMEKLGQYLHDTPLTIPSEIETNEWNTFLNQNECIKQHPSIIKHYKDKSLIQQFNMLEKCVSNIFEKLQFSVVQEFEPLHILDVLNLNHTTLKITNISCEPSTVLFGLLTSTIPSPSFYFLEISANDGIKIKGGTLCIPQHQESELHAENYDILDIQFYSTNLLSLLLQDHSAAKTATIYQCPITTLRDRIVDVNMHTTIYDQALLRINANTLGNPVLKTLDGLTASTFAVSGFRNVSVVLAENKRKVRIYEMEAEEDEEEDAEMTNSTVRESDISMPENSDGD